MKDKQFLIDKFNEAITYAKSKYKPLPSTEEEVTIEFGLILSKLDEELIEQGRDVLLKDYEKIKDASGKQLKNLKRNLKPYPGDMIIPINAPMDWIESQAFFYSALSIAYGSIIEYLRRYKSAPSPVKHFKPKAIGMAYIILKEPITAENVDEIRARWKCKTNAKEILEARREKKESIFMIRDNKRASSIHLANLYGARDIIESEKDTKALDEIDSIIASYSKAHEIKYK